MKSQFAKYTAACLALLLTAALWSCGKDAVSQADAELSGAAEASLTTTAATSEAADENADPTESAETSAAESSSNADSEIVTNDADNQPAVSDDAASAPDTPQPGSDAQSDPDYEIGNAPTVGIGRITVKEGQREAAVSLQFWNNPGYTTSGIQIFYDAALQLKMEDDGSTPVHDAGAAADGLMAVCIASPDNHVIAFGTLGNENNSESGTLCTLYFTIPEDTSAGTVYSFAVAIDSVINEEMKDVNTEIIGGEIRIE